MEDQGFPGRGNFKEGRQPIIWHNFCRKLPVTLRVYADDVLSTANHCGSKGELKGPVPPTGPNSFNFIQFLEKLGKIVC